LNFIGGALFLVAGVAGIAGVEEKMALWLVDFTYLLGSIAFMFGGLCALWLWKSEFYGLGLLSEMNVLRRHEGEIEVIQKSQEQYGCGKSNIWQLPWIFLYICNACAGVVSLGIVFAYKETGTADMFN
jgi:hypothetical protein